MAFVLTRGLWCLGMGALCRAMLVRLGAEATDGGPATDCLPQQLFCGHGVLKGAWPYFQCCVMGLGATLNTFEEV